MLKLIEKYPALSILLFIIIAFGFTIDSIPVTIMEARNFISAREMLSDNNWILTTMNGEARYQKPPLPTWITAVFGSVFGMSSLLALRWPAILMVALVGITIYLLSKALDLSKSNSLINGFIVVTSFYVIGICIEGPWDIYAHGFMLGSVFFLFKMLQNQRIQIGFAAGFVILLACSILSKGPVSLYVLFLSFIIAFGISLGYKKVGKGFYLKLLGLLVLGLVLGSSWYLYVRAADPETFTKITSKETSNWGSYNVRPFYYYWSFFVQSGIWTIPALMSLLYPYLKSRVQHKQVYRFSFFWTIAAVILLSIIPEKKSRYLMPVLIPLAINIGCYIQYAVIEFKSWRSKTERLPIYVSFGIIALIATLFWVLIFFAPAFSIELEITRFVIASLVLLAIGLILIINLKAGNIKNLFYATIVFIAAIGLLVLPLAKSPSSERIESFEMLKKDQLAVFNYDYVAPEVIYLYGTTIPNLNLDQLAGSNGEKAYYLLSQNKDPYEDEELVKQYQIEFVGKLDFNSAKEGQKNHRSRLLNSLYLIKKKP